MVYWLAWRRRSTESVSGYGACGAWSICPGSRTSGLPPISPRFAAYHRGHSRAMSTSDASGPSWAATMSHSVSPASTVTGPAPPPVARGSGIALAALGASLVYLGMSVGLKLDPIASAWTAIAVGFTIRAASVRYNIATRPIRGFDEDESGDGV